MKEKKLFSIFVILSAFLLTGCELAVTNLTPAKMPENPSGIYTVSMSARVRDGAVVADSITPQIVINGQTQYMQPDDQKARIYDFDYAMPVGQNEVAYYFVIDYQTLVHGKVRERQIISELHTMSLVNRYVQTLDSDRAPAGSVVHVMGRGFKPLDTIIMGQEETKTTFISENALSFTVPHLPAGQSYPVYIKNDKDVLFIDNFRLDPSKIQANVASLNLFEGSTSSLELMLEKGAPEGGVELKITTDIPDSIIMPQAAFEAGAKRLSIDIEGGQPDEGYLYVEAEGFSELVIPVMVRTL